LNQSAGKLQDKACKQAARSRNINPFLCCPFKPTSFNFKMVVLDPKTEI